MKLHHYSGKTFGHFFAAFVTSCLFISTGSAQAFTITTSSSCEDYVDCDTGMTADTTQDSGYEGYDYDTESEHFIFFLDGDSAETPLITDEEYAIVQDEFECAYRYFICEQGYPAPTSEKTHVYIGDNGSAASSDYITINDAYFNSSSLTYKLYVVPAHEFYHLVQKQYFSGSDESIKEASAVLGEQLVARENYDYSIADDGYGRAYALSQPHFHATYSLNVFMRYVFEQLGGRVSLSDSQLWDHSRLVTGIHLKGMAEYVDANYASLPDIEISSIFDAYIPYAATSSSLVTSLDQAEGNYITAQYAYPYVNRRLQPQYAFLTGAELQNETSFTFYSENNAVGVGDTLTFSNEATEYTTPVGSYDPYGFWYYLNAEYHELDADTSVNRLRVTKAAGDSYIEGRLIVRRTDGRVESHDLFSAAVSTKTVILRDKSTIAEIVLVAFTTKNIPLTSGEGRTYDFTVEGLN